ncbi:SPOR domain-containing protein [Edwardsiella tarda]|uniref:SPOR domain-containing protein n=1 Tax=Edwardsiella tarda TaxID=636 RepID=UPI00351BF088
MDQEEFKADDELKPDASDRRPPRTRNRRPASPRLAVSRQHLMIGAGVLVLLVVIVAIGSALKSPSKGSAAPAGATSGAREINLANTSSPTNATASGSNLTDMQDGSGVSNSAQPGQPQPISMPPVSSTPTQSAPAMPANGQQRIDLAGNSISDALTQQQGALDSLAQVDTLPTGPATLASGAARQPKAVENGLRPLPSKTTPRREEKAPSRHNEKRPQRTPEASAPKQTAHLPVVGSNGKQAAHLPTAAGSSAGSSLKSAPASHYTLQLSGASQPNTLNAFARRQNLSHYWVYETSRNGKPWYVLVSGSYATPAEARRAVASLPAEVQAMKPWARPLSQVQKDAK